MNTIVRARGASGFTLVEVLVVLIVVGVAGALIVVRLGSDDRRAGEREAWRLAGALEHAAALAQWRGDTLGVSAEGHSYRFWQRGADNRWAAIAGDDVLLPRTLPAQMLVTPISYAGTPVPPDAILPLRASGRNEPYALTLASSTWSVVIAADPLYRVQVAGGQRVASP